MDEDTRRELEASLAARKHLGPEYEDHLVERFLEKVDKGLARGREEDRRPNATREKALAIPVILGSGGIGIAVTAIALSNAPGVGGVIVAVAAWIAIWFVNVAFWRH